MTQFVIHPSFLAPGDYTSLSEPHTFTPGGPTRRCSTIQISADDVVESSETFTAGLQSSVDILDTPISASIILLDNSRKHTHNVLHQLLTLLPTSPTELTLSLSASEYFVSEGLRMRVCVVIASGRTERLVTYRVTPGGGSASSMPTITCCLPTQRRPTYTL